MKRRDLIKSTSLLLPSIHLLASVGSFKPNAKTKNAVSGFIFSDAHIGWKNKKQPTLKTQIEMIQVVKNRFPDLDLVFDTGDIHHGYLNDSERNTARDFWLSNMANAFSEAFFHYIPGNHELTKSYGDEELMASALGSGNFRPYYAFDFNGIHFISLPQLSDTLLINKESLSWLKHDLALNPNKTTIILSHNSLAGTTYTGGVTAYREVVNSEEVFEAIDNHKHVIAWLHGHNHQYEIVKNNDRLYVSNGRMGGFIPPKSWGDMGQGHLGGVYFEIGTNGLKVKCFSATENAFFEDLGKGHLSASIRKQTSYDSKEGLSYYYGHGCLTNGIKHQVFNHYLTPDPPEISLLQLDDPVLNDNANLKLKTNFYSPNSEVKKLIGFQVEPESIEIKTVSDGLLIKNKGKPVTVYMPKIGKKNKPYKNRASYYRCEWGDVFNVDIELSKQSSIKKKDRLAVVNSKYTVFDKDLQTVFESEITEKVVKDGKVKIQIKLPNERKIEIGNEKYLRMAFEFVDLPDPVVFTQFSLSKANPTDDKPGLLLNHKPQEFVKLTDEKKLSLSKIKCNEINCLSLSGMNSVSCVIKRKGVQWQVRNGLARLIDNKIEVMNYRHHIQKVNEVILTPASKPPVYVNKVVNLMPVVIQYMKNRIEVSCKNISENSSIVFMYSKKPKNVTGHKRLKIGSNYIAVSPKDLIVTIEF